MDGAEEFENSGHSGGWAHGGRGARHPQRRIPVARSSGLEPDPGHSRPLFDSTDIALQDSATVPLEYERAMAAGVGIEKKMIST